MSRPITIEIQPADALGEVLGIRRQVFVEEQGIPLELDLDGVDGRSIHILARVGEVPAGTGRLTPELDRTGTLARIAVLPAFRRRQLGRLIVQELESIATRQGLLCLTLTPHHYLERFYRDLGYRMVPAVVPPAGAHRLIRMIKTLNR